MSRDRCMASPKPAPAAPPTPSAPIGTTVPLAGVYPPPDKPFKTRSEPASTWYRVHKFDGATGKYGPIDFNDTSLGNARFSPLIDPTTNKVVPTIYAAESPRGAIAEIVLHDVPTPSSGYIHDWERDRTSKLHVSAITLAKLDLVNLTTTGLRAAGLKVSDLFDGNAPDYPRTRDWALYIWQNVPKAHGILWMSVRDNTSKVVVLFHDRVVLDEHGNPHNPPLIADALDSQHIVQFKADVLQLIDELDGSLAPVI